MNMTFSYSSNSPFVSVILPIRNEQAHILNVIMAILNQDYPINKMEVIIVDGLSTDNTISILKPIVECNSIVKVITNQPKIVPTAMNRAISLAKGEIIIRIDGHTLPASDYVTQCVKLLIQSNVSNVGGRMMAVGATKFGEAVSYATSSYFGVGGAKFHYSDKEEFVDTVYMGAWPRKVFEYIGLFDEELIRDQDDELNYRIREHNGKILLSPKIISSYSVRSTPRALWKQYFQYGFWKVRVMQKHPRQMSPRQFVPPTFALSLIASFVILQWSWIPLALTGGSYLIANLIASLMTAAKRGWKQLPLLPITFFILHFSYGLGFLVGLGKFANRWRDKQGKVPALELR